MVAVIDVIYDEGNETDLGYEGVELTHDGEAFWFDSGDFVKDWYNMRKKLSQMENIYVASSSSVDHFIMDGAPYDSAWLHIVDEKPVLKYGDENYNGGLEFFVAENTQPTWEELKKMCTE